MICNFLYCSKIEYLVSLFLCRVGPGAVVVRQQAAAEEEAQVADGVHQPPDLRAGEAVPLPEVPLPGRQGRDRGHTRPLKRAGQQLDS